jgi:hypothetical protein
LRRECPLMTQSGHCQDSEGVALTPNRQAPFPLAGQRSNIT